jgi:hypothetical protein
MKTRRIYETSMESLLDLQINIPTDYASMLQTQTKHSKVESVKEVPERKEPSSKTVSVWEYKHVNRPKKER